jgi:hypothetical protein
MRSDSSCCTTQSDSGFVNRRLRPVCGSRRLSVLFQTQRPYFSLSSRRLTVAGDQPFAERGIGEKSCVSVRSEKYCFRQHADRVREPSPAPGLTTAFDQELTTLFEKSSFVETPLD